MHPEGSCSPWRTYTGAGSSQDLWPAGDLHWRSLFLMNCNMWRGPTPEQFLKKNPWKGPPTEQFVKGCIPWERLRARSRANYEEERAVERECYELTTSHGSSPSLRCLGREKVEESGMKLNFGRRERLEEDVSVLPLFLIILLYF